MDNIRLLPMNVREITAKDDLAWDELVKSSLQVSVFLLKDCLNTWIASDPSLSLLRYGCFDRENQLVGGQAFSYRKKALGLRAETPLNISYHAGSPILAGHITPGSAEYFSILDALARQTERAFPYYSADCHPSLQDLRPYLQRNWRVTPDYSHVWDISNPETFFDSLNMKAHRRCRFINTAFETLDFAEETGKEIIQEFLPLYRESVQHYGLELCKTWDSTFSQRVEWMLDQQIFRFYTCRRRDGELLGISTYVLNDFNHSVYCWLVAYTRSCVESDFVRALYLYAGKALGGKYHSLDMAEGLRPSLYEFKDSIGTCSKRYYRIETPNSNNWHRFYKQYRQLKTAMSKLVH